MIQIRFLYITDGIQTISITIFLRILYFSLYIRLFLFLFETSYTDLIFGSTISEPII